MPLQPSGNCRPQIGRGLDPAEQLRFLCRELFLGQNAFPVQLGETVLGFSAKRSLPEWQSRHFFNDAPVTASRDEVLAAQKPVVLFVDTFNGYFESENPRAAVKVQWV